MIGPAPITRIEEMSVRLGIYEYQAILFAQAERDCFAFRPGQRLWLQRRIVDAHFFAIAIKRQNPVVPAVHA